MGLVSGGEDGSVMVWEGTELVQKIPHPSCVWCILGLKGLFIFFFIYYNLIIFNFVVL